MLVVERRGDRLVLKAHVGKADRTRRRFERRLGLGIARRIVIDEEHRPAEHHSFDRRAHTRLGLLLQVAQVAGHHVEVGHRVATAEIGAAQGERRAEDALHRAHQAALGAFDISGDRRAAVQPPRLLVPSQPFDGVEHRRRHRRPAGFDFEQLHGAVGRVRRRHRDAGVGRAEIDRAVHGAQPVVIVSAPDPSSARRPPRPAAAR